MDVGDFVQEAYSTLARRTVNGTTVSVTLNNVQAGNILILWAMAETADDDWTVSGGGWGTWVRPVGTWQDGARPGPRHGNVWYITNASAGSGTATLTMTSQGGYWSQVILLEFHGTPTTVYDILGSNFYSEIPALATHGFTTPGNGFAWCYGSQKYTNGYFASAIDPSTYWDLYTGGALSGQYGSVAVGMFGQWGTRQWQHEQKDPWCSFDNAGARGASVDGDGLILCFVDPSGETAHQAPTGGSPAAYIRYSKGQKASSGVTVTIGTIVTPPVAGDLLIIIYRGSAAALTRNDATSNGFTTIVDNTLDLGIWAGYKIATGSEPSSYTFTATAGNGPGAIYTDIISTGFDSLIYSTGYIKSRYPGLNFVNDDGEWDVEGIQGTSIWLAALFHTGGVGFPTYHSASVLEPGTWSNIISDGGGLVTLAGILDTNGTAPLAMALSAEDVGTLGDAYTQRGLLMMVTRTAQDIGGGPEGWVHLRLTRATATELPYQVHTKMLGQENL